MLIEQKMASLTRQTHAKKVSSVTTHGCPRTTAIDRTSLTTESSSEKIDRHASLIHHKWEEKRGSQSTNKRKTDSHQSVSKPDAGRLWRCAQSAHHSSVHHSSSLHYTHGTTHHTP
uniref:Uncharacterized protein n=1 Tax=Vitrella brassicaformis TaxID=1169539 RepID=A0A7S1K1K3_9ALVE|mmetsp:Transcript_3340/g.7583  ORF Transcript_3340/g.7583 Transcript_3340/m.7583 type:complete len:116 (+) Transcript_3340:318-665(+)